MKTANITNEIEAAAGLEDFNADGGVTCQINQCAVLLARQFIGLTLTPLSRMFLGNAMVAFPMVFALPHPSTILKGEITDRLAMSRLGRVSLHALCLFRHPSRARWHWKGIVREISRH